MGLDHQGHDPTGLAGLGDHSHSTQDGFSPGMLWERGWASLFTLVDSRAAQGWNVTGHGCSPEAAVPSQQLWLHPCHGSQHQAFPCRSHLQLWPEVLMWKSSLGRCTKAKMLRGVRGNLGKPPCWVPEQHMLCPALSHSWGSQIWHTVPCWCGYPAPVPGCHRQAPCKSSWTSVCGQLLAIPPSDCSASLK